MQDEEFRFDQDIETSYKEMTERLAKDPVGQCIVFELMMRLFFIHVLGLEEDAVGWKRGEVKKEASGWSSDGVAGDFNRPWSFGPIAAAFGAVEARDEDLCIRKSWFGCCMHRWRKLLIFL